MKICLVAVLAAAGFAVTPALADWPMFMGDAGRTGRVQAQDGAADLKPAWRHRLPTQLTASPVVAEGRLFVAGENGNLYAFDLTSRRLDWIYRADGGFGSTPAAGDGRVYALSRDGTVHAVEAATGKPIWRFRTGGEGRFGVAGGYGQPVDNGIVPDPWDFYLSSPLVQDERVYVGSSDGHLYALDAVTGKKRWSFQADASIHSSPAYNNGLIFFGTWGTTLYALEAATGEKRWSFQGGTDAKNGVFQGIQASPALDGDTVYAGARDGFVYALTQATGELKWTYDAEKSWVLSTAAVDDASIYFGTSDTGLFIALDKATGKERFRGDTRVWTYASPVVAGRTGYVGSMTGILYGFDVETGREAWRYQTDESHADPRDIIDDAGKLRGDVLFAPGRQMDAAVEEVKALGAFVASPVWHDGQLIAFTANGEILIFAH